MKRLISLFLCLLVLSFTLVGCTDDEIGSYLPNYKGNEENQDDLVSLNFYIIVEDGTSNEAKTTVPQNINTYLKEKYNIALNINYCLANEYDSIVVEAAKNEDDSKRADIVLINSKELFTSLHNNGLLVDLTKYYEAKNENRKYGSINAIVEKNLLSASLVDGCYYSVPNNHRIGEYEYIVINKTLSKDILHFAPNKEISNMTTLESLEPLKSAMSDYYVSNPSLASEYSTVDEFINDNIKIVKGNYEDKILHEYDVTDLSLITVDSKKVNYVNILSYPVVDADEAFVSAFSIVKNASHNGEMTEEKEAVLNNHYAKCMDIIYALNTDVALKNMLQYGYVGTNYKFIKNEKNENTGYIELYKGDDVKYLMNPIYTGNEYISYYCEELDWTEAIHDNILKQNGESILPQ